MLNNIVTLYNKIDSLLESKKYDLNNNYKKRHN